MSPWIKCSERLPELRDDSVLAYSATGADRGWAVGGIDMVHIQDYFGDITNGLAPDGTQLYTKWYLHQGVTHWMPLPAPPTE